jgi:cell division protease FtsH
LKQNKSFKTLALWVFLVVMFFAIYQTVSTGGVGRQLTLSEFIAKALPAAGASDGDRTGPLQEVVVRGELIEFAAQLPGDRFEEKRQDLDEEAGARSTGSSATVDAPWNHTWGDIKMPIGSVNGETLLSSLTTRGVPVRFSATDAQYTPRGDSRPFSELLNQLRKQRAPTEIRSIVIRGKEITGELKTGEAFVTVGELGDYRAALIGRGIEITEENEAAGSLWLSILGTWLPMIFIFAIFFMFMRQLQSGGGKAMSFGKSRHRLLNESTNKVTFKDVAGIKEAKDELEEIVHFLKDPKKFTRLGARIPKGVLLMGPPGTGKTLLAKAVAGEAGVPFFSISGSDFVEMFVGVGASRVRDLFEQGKKNAPCIIFIDEMDAVGRQRGAGLGGGHDEREQTLNQLLVEMDGFESNEGVILMAATNRPDVLDPALLRPGRFDRRVIVSRPDVKGRHEILQVHVRNKRLSSNVDLEVIARGTPGFSGADLENLVNESALLAASLDKDAIEGADMEAAKDKVLMGAERRSVVLSDEDKHVTAVHEAGHTLVARIVPGNDPVHKVTIIPRGMALGVTWTLPEQDQYNLSEEQVTGRIAMAMGGRVAEQLVFGRLTTGAGNDIEQATKLARKMVCEWGMSRLGPIALAREKGDVFLGRDIARSDDFSDATQSEADQEIRRLLGEGHTLATSVVKEHQATLERITNALLEFESIGGEEVGLLVDGGGNDAVRLHREAAAAAAHTVSEPSPQRAEAEEKPREPIVTQMPDPEPV